MCFFIALALVGCEPLVAGDAPIAARVQDDVFSITVCRSWPLTKVLVQTRSSGFGQQWEDVWVAEGHLDLRPGDVLTSASAPADLSVTSWGEFTLEPGDNLTITLVGEDYETLDAIVQVPASGFPKNGWLQADGTVTDSAC